MSENHVEMQYIARIRTKFPTKFGIPRQSGLVPLEAMIVFEPPYRDENALRGIEEFSHLWILWYFSESAGTSFSPTVRPPRLGGNVRMGVFATRSPFRPNPIGLSSVRLERIEKHPEYGMVLYVTGADMMDGTPLFDIKPYLPFSDSHPDALGGFSAALKDYTLEVELSPELEAKIPQALRSGLHGVLAQDPRPSYVDDPLRVFGVWFDCYDIRFRVEGKRLIVLEIIEKNA